MIKPRQSYTLISYGFLAAIFVLLALEPEGVDKLSRQQMSG
jgi:hypothetical protein